MTTLVQFAHAALFSPALTTLSAALDRNFITDIPGLTSQSIRLHPPISAATVKGHLDQVRKNLRPSQKTPNEPTPLLQLNEYSDKEQNNFLSSEQTTDDDMHPEYIEEATHACYAACIQQPTTGKT